MSETSEALEQAGGHPRTFHSGSASTVMNLMLIDLSSIAHPLFHTEASNPNPNAISEAIVSRIRGLASTQLHVAICCDNGKSFRNELTPEYKANRKSEDRAVLYHQIGLALDTLRGDGFPVWIAPGFEADDVIATAAQRAAEQDQDVVIVSADKDLLQLIGPGVTAKSLKDGSIIDEAAVVAKFGVKPSQMRDYLTLVGDASDNIKGAAGIGEVGAAKLLGNFSSLDLLYPQLDMVTKADGITPSQVLSLKALAPRLALTRQLLTLRTDAEIPFAEILEPRQVRDLAPMETEQMPDQIDEAMPTIKTVAPQNSVAAELTQGTMTLAVQTPVLAPAPPEWERQLEPRSMDETIRLAKYVFESRLFSAYGTPQAVLTTLLAGRELGLQAMSSLRAFHIVEGKPTMAADLIRAIVLKSGKVRFFRCTERTPDKATFQIQRGDDPVVSLTYTVAEGRAAFSGDDAKWAKSGWGKNPADMCVARAGAKLARLVCPDIIHGLYAGEEFDNGN